MEIRVDNFSIVKTTADWVVREHLITQDGKNKGEEYTVNIAYCGSFDRAVIRLRELCFERNFEKYDTADMVTSETLRQMEELNIKAKGEWHGKNFYNRSTV